MSLASLFSPFTYKSLTLANRIVMAPMTRSHSPGGVPTADVAAYYRRRAAADVGLIISEGTGINRPAALNGPDMPRFHGEKELAAWQTVIDEVHEVGGVMAPQLWHVGAVKTREKSWVPSGPYDSPSGLAGPGRALGKAMADHEIADAIAAFAQGAADAKRLGFDAVEFHGAHGYLIDQFFWEGTNARDCRYGGASLPQRVNFAADILKATRLAVGADFTIILRISQWKSQDYLAKLANTPGEMEAWLTPLVDAGADILHCSQRRFWEPEFEDQGSDLNFAGWAKKITGQPTITVGSVGLSADFFGAFVGMGSELASLDELFRRLDRGDFDLVGVGRALLQDPHWASKIKDGRLGELQPYSGDALATLT